MKLFNYRANMERTKRADVKTRKDFSLFLRARFAARPLQQRPDRETSSAVYHSSFLRSSSASSSSLTARFSFTPATPPALLPLSLSLPGYQLTATLLSSCLPPSLSPIFPILCGSFFEFFQANNNRKNRHLGFVLGTMQPPPAGGVICFENARLPGTRFHRGAAARSLNPLAPPIVNYLESCADKN